MPDEGISGLPDDGAALLGDLVLPPGHQVRTTLVANEPPPGAPWLWVTDSQIENPGLLWSQLQVESERVGLTALLLDDLRSSWGRPWDTSEFLPTREQQPEDYDPDHIFRQRWQHYVPLGSLPPGDRPELRPSPLTEVFGTIEFEEDEEETAEFLKIASPWGVQFPGLALAERNPGDATRYEEAVSATPAARIGLVVSGRAADVPYVIGWMGATNHFVRDLGPAVLGAMMRSWEDRFGARLFRLGFDTMEFTVERPPASEASALAIAAEHFAFASTDGFAAQPVPIHSIRSLAEHILDNPVWRFWWD